MDYLLNIFPSTPGLLPKWQFFVSTLAFFNTAQNFATIALTRRIYSRTPNEVTPLQSRTFAIWTWISAVVRLTCAYHIHEKAIYDVTLWSYVGALAHFLSEWLIFRTAGLGAGLAGPLIVAPVSFVWMWMQYDHYVQY